MAVARKRKNKKQSFFKRIFLKFKNSFFIIFLKCAWIFLKKILIEVKNRVKNARIWVIIGNFFFRLAESYHFFFLLFLFLKRLSFIFRIFFFCICLFFLLCLEIFLFFFIVVPQNCYVTLKLTFLYSIKYIYFKLDFFLLIFYKYIWTPFIGWVKVCLWTIILFSFRYLVRDFTLFCMFVDTNAQRKRAAEEKHRREEREKQIEDAIKKGNLEILIEPEPLWRWPDKKGNYRFFYYFKMYFFYIYFDFLKFFVIKFFNKLYKFLYKVYKFLCRHSFLLRIISWIIRFIFKIIKIIFRILKYFRISRFIIKIIYYFLLLTFRLILNIIVHIIFFIFFIIFLYFYIFFFIFFFFFNFELKYFVHYVKTVKTQYYLVFWRAFRECFSAIKNYYKDFFICFFCRLFRAPFFEINIHRLYVLFCFFIFYYNLFGIYSLYFPFLFLFFPIAFTFCRFVYTVLYFFNNFLWNYALFVQKYYPDNNIYKEDMKPMTEFDIFLKLYFVGAEFREFLDFVKSIDYLVYLFDIVNNQLLASFLSFNQCVLSFNPLLSKNERYFLHFDIYQHFKSKSMAKRIKKNMLSLKAKTLEQSLWETYWKEFMLYHWLKGFLKFIFFTVLPYIFFVFSRIWIRVNYHLFKLKVGIFFSEKKINYYNHDFWYIYYFIQAFIKTKRVRECSLGYVKYTLLMWKYKFKLKYFDFISYRFVSIIVKRLKIFSAFIFPQWLRDRLISLRLFFFPSSYWFVFKIIWGYYKLTYFESFVFLVWGFDNELKKFYLYFINMIIFISILLFLIFFFFFLWLSF